MEKHKNKIITLAAIVIVLLFVFLYGGDAPEFNRWTFEPEETTLLVQNDKFTKEEIVSEAKESNPIKQDNKSIILEEKIDTVEKITENTKKYSEDYEKEKNNGDEKDKYKTDPVFEKKPVPVEPEKSVITHKELTCTLSVKCDTILKNISRLNKEKIDIVPENGIIFEEKTVVFYEGESVFNLLYREMKQNKIHIEFENTPIYNSAYIEGIANLYELDCGELSGWMYKVNDWFPNYGCSRYQLKAGDKVEWVYTCDLGIDVGGNYSARNGK